MIHLIIVSFIWAFSFGLIKQQLVGLDSSFVAAARLGLSLLVFLPFLRLGRIPWPLRRRLMLIGAIQYGLMYVTYIYAFTWLASYHVALFTIFTPLYVTLLHDLRRRRFHPFSLGTALLAVAGTAIILFHGLADSGLLLGFLLMQLSNGCFAYGQIAYRETMADAGDLRDHQVFALLYVGAFAVAGSMAVVTTPWSSLSLDTSQLLALLYLGVLASGICFFLWNHGARQTTPGALAIANNLKIPLAVACSLFIFGEDANLPRLLLGGAIIAASLILHERHVRCASALPEATVGAAKPD